MSEFSNLVIRPLDTDHYLAVSYEMAIYAMVVDAIDERAQHFYEQFGFTLLCSSNRRLFLPLKSA